MSIGLDRMTMNQNEAYAAPAGGITGVLNVAYGVINKQKVLAEPEYAEVSEIPRNKKKTKCSVHCFMTSIRKYLPIRYYWILSLNIFTFKNMILQFYS